MHRLATLSFLALAALLAAPAALAQSVLVLWGDSVVCGYGADAGTGTPYGPSPFGDPIEGAWRWDEAGQRWAPLTAEQNLQGTGADPAYGAAAAWLAIHRSAGPVFVIALGVPGTDVTPATVRANASWSPTVAGSALERFVRRSLRPALASLEHPRVELVCGSAGNNCVPDWGRFQADLAATWSALLAELPGTPRTLMLRSYRLEDVEARAAVAASGHAVVDLDQLPARADGLQRDGVHLTHYGNVCAGARLALTAALTPTPRPTPRPAGAAAGAAPSAH